MSPGHRPLGRREFLARSVALFFAALSLAALSLLAAVVYPRTVRKKELSFHAVCAEDELPARGVRPFPLKYTAAGGPVESRIFIVRSETDLFALSPVCTHLGCLVTWHRVKGRFLCPCHGGQYAMDGRVLEGPPPAPLHRLPLRIENEKVFVGIKV